MSSQCLHNGSTHLRLPGQCLLLLLVATIASRTLGAGALAAAATSPNVIVVMADDIGLGDIGFYHRQRTGKEPVVPTPYLDRLVAEGMRFSDAHAPASLCAPTRFSMLTGNYPCRNYRPFGVWAFHADPGIDPRYTTSARLAKAGGYRTAFFGKWGLGGSFPSKSGERPFTWGDKEADFTRMNTGALHFGFDYACELPSGIQGQPFAFYENRKWMRLDPNSVIAELGPEQTGYSTSRKHRTLRGMGDSHWDPAQAGPILARKAVAYIEQHADQHRDDPFFLYYCSQAVHIPHTPPEELNGVRIAGSTPAVHGDMIRELDVQIGMLRAALQAGDLHQNTLFIFTSDNGGLRPDAPLAEKGHDSSNGWRGSKGAIYEGGHRVPFLAVWPGNIAPNTESHEPIIGHDVVATVAALAGQTVPRSRLKDAINLLPLFTGTLPTERHRYLLHQQEAGPHYAIRDGDWKLIMRAENQKNLAGLKPEALFNLIENPTEQDAHNLVHAPEHTVRSQAMLTAYIRLRTKGVPTVSRNGHEPSP